MPHSPLTTPYFAAALITVICVVLTLNMAALKDGSVGCLVALALLLAALLFFTIIIWRQPQSNARLNFKVSAAPCILVSAPPALHQDLGIVGSARARCQAVTRKGSERHPETCLSEVQSSVWKCRGALGCGRDGVLLLASSILEPSLVPQGTADTALLVPCRSLSCHSCQSSVPSLTSC